MTEDDVLTFARTVLGSVWTLEILLILHRGQDTAWPEAELIGHLRATARVVNESLGDLVKAGLVAREEQDRYRYAPASSTMAQAVDALAELHQRKPLAVTNAVLKSRNDKIRTFADAFRFRK